jgi:DNA-binding MarR family transcriptional regulator
MQSLLDASTSAASDEGCSRALLDTVPLVMKTIREQMRRHRSGLTVPQFRTLCFISSAMGNSLSSVADFIGLSLPAMSRLVDGLVEKSLMTRRPSDDDRRHVRLGVTLAGKAAIDEARQLAQAHMAGTLAELSPRQRATIANAMQTLRTVFGN